MRYNLAIKKLDKSTMLHVILGDDRKSLKVVGVLSVLAKVKKMVLIRTDCVNGLGTTASFTPDSLLLGGQVCPPKL
jgi:hypothetical protein